MNSSAGNSTDWMQFYEQTVDAATIVTAASAESNLSQLTPKGCSSKPIKRRPRASKNKPTALLNANATNFRALVQQFTGCPTTTHLSTYRRGSINLNFALGTEYNQSGTATMPVSRNDYYYHHQLSHQENASYHQQLNHQENASYHQQLSHQENASYQQQLSHQENASYQRQQQQQQQHHAVPFDNVDPNAFFSSSSTRANADDQILDDFNLDNISLQEFNRDFPYSNENANDGNYFL